MNVQNKVCLKNNFSENNNITLRGDDLRTNMRNSLGLTAGAHVDSIPGICSQEAAGQQAAHDFPPKTFPKQCIFCIFQANCICSFQIGTKKI